MRRFLRKTAFKILRRDIAKFLEDHEADLLRICADELQKLDNRIPEEQTFIDIRMVALGECLMQAILSGARRFLTETPARKA